MHNSDVQRKSKRERLEKRGEAGKWLFMLYA